MRHERQVPLSPPLVFLGLVLIGLGLTAALKRGRGGTGSECQGRAVAKAIVFDVNETLLDTRALDPYFERVFGTAAAREPWFKELESLMLSTVATGAYRDFSALATAALEMCAEKEGIDLSSNDRAELLERLTTLPPYPDAAQALAGLKDKGLRMAALSNGTLAATKAQLKHADLTAFFEEILSSDEVECHKPGSPPYRMSAERMKLSPKDMCLVAAHAWDLAGAHAAGLQTAFVARPSKVLDPTGARPDFKAGDLLDFTRQILRGAQKQHERAKDVRSQQDTHRYVRYVANL